MDQLRILREIASMLFNSNMKIWVAEKSMSVLLTWTVGAGAQPTVIKGLKSFHWTCLWRTTGNCSTAFFLSSSLIKCMLDLLLQKYKP